jgi:ABC-type glycerol-3-phosphate transport system substrate-binding protein
MLRTSKAGLALLLVLAVLMTACGESPATSTSVPAAATDTPAPAAAAATDTPAAMAAATDTPATGGGEATATATIGIPTVGPTPVVPAGVTTIKVVDWVAENTSSWANRWYKPFEEANPDIKIVHEQITGNYIETVLTRLTGSNDIDLIWVAPDSVGSFLRSGAALDLTDKIKAEGDSLQLDKFPQWTKDDYTTVR